MAIIVFSDVQLPNSVIAAGVRGKQIRRNDRIETDNGDVSVNIGRAQTLREFEIGIVPMKVALWQDVETVYEITEAGAYGFLLEDPKDSRVTNGVVTEVSTGVYQLYKRYLHTASGRYKDRKITRPVESSLSVLNVATPLTLGVDYTVDDETGLLTIPALPDAEDITWTGRFLVPVHFLDDSIDWELVVAGAADARFAAGPSCILREVRE